jgi:hypothetical protein
MTDRLNNAEISSQVDLPSGGKIILLDRLAKEHLYSKEEMARNIFKINKIGHLEWQIQSDFDAEGQPFTRLHYDNGKVTAYRWDGGVYVINIETGDAKLRILMR